VRLLLDTGVLGQICHPKKHHDVRTWFGRAVREHDCLISEVADYELRRELLRIGSHKSLDRLDELATVVTSNEKHFKGIAAALSWTDVPMPET
jgi:hypothetical protein